MTPLHEAARAFASAGIPVFPCVENGKQPATANGFKDATADLAQIDAWWTENPNYNLALSPDDMGWCVVDIEAEGETPWAEVAAQHEVPDTYEVRTPRGGRHLYFTGRLPPTVQKIAAKVDTRGIGSYVLVPPSIVDGKAYEVIEDREIAAVPRFVEDAVGVRHDATKAAEDRVDLPGSVARARALLEAMVKRGDVAREGSGGDNRTYALCAEVLNLGLSTDTALDLISGVWNPHCIPPWDEQDLRLKLENAAAYAQNEQGAWAVPPAAEAFGAALDQLATHQPPEKRSRFHLEDEEEQDAGADPEWLIKDLIQERSTVLLLGPSKHYKSFLALDMALGIAANVETFNALPKPGPTVYAALEGKANIKRARRRAWRLARGIEKPVEDFFVTTAPMIGLEDEVQQFGDEIAKRLKDRKPRLIVLDTLAKCMAGLNENDAGDAGRFIRFCDSLVEAFDCCVIAIHHTGKDDSRGARGSSAFYAGFDTVLEVKATNGPKAVEVRVRKHKDAEEREQPWTLKGRLIGPSLVFFSTTPEEHAELTKAPEDFGSAEVGGALVKLNAYGVENGVSTTVLASELVPAVESESVDQRQSSIGQVSKKLGALSRTKLRAYVTTKGSGIVWHLPEKEAT